MIFVVIVLALGGIAAGMILLEDSWLQLLLAGALGVILPSSPSWGMGPPTARSSSPGRRTTAADERWRAS
jgi:hypothetical protein